MHKVSDEEKAIMGVVSFFLFFIVFFDYLWQRKHYKQNTKGKRSYRRLSEDAFTGLQAELSDLCGGRCAFCG